MTQKQIKQLLVKARLAEIEGGRISANFTGKKEKEGLLRRKFIARKGAGFSLTDSGRKKVRVVMTGGVFDILHLGHVHTLEKARRKGDALVVAVAHDATVRRSKGRPPIYSAKERAALLGKLRCVDLALVGHPKDRMVTARRVKPDVVVYGYDQKSAMRLKARVMRLKKGVQEGRFKTSKALEGLCREA